MGIKKEQRLAPTFVNLKSNTMKNTLQRYGLQRNLQIIQVKKDVIKHTLRKKFFLLRPDKGFGGMKLYQVIFIFLLPMLFLR